MNTQLPLWKVVLLGVAAYLIFAAPKTGGCNLPVIGEKAPFVADKLTVAVIHDGSDTTNLPLWANDTDANSVDVFVKAAGGEFRIIEQKSDMANAAQKWKDAMAVPRKSVPWIVAANAKSGFSQAATTKADALAALKKAEGK